MAPKPHHVQSILGSPALLERLAAIEHERWADWQSYVHENCIAHEDGSLTIPAALVERWRRQISRSYADLSETEKASDREQVWRYLPLIADELTSADGQE